MLIQIAKIFNTTTDYLIGKTDDPIVPTKKNKINSNPTFADLGMHCEQKISEELKRTYIDLAESYFKRHPEMHNNEKNKL